VKKARRTRTSTPRVLYPDDAILQQCGGSGTRRDPELLESRGNFPCTREGSGGEQGREVLRKWRFMVWPGRTARKKPRTGRPTRAMSPRKSRTLWRTNSSGSGAPRCCGRCRPPPRWRCPATRRGRGRRRAGSRSARGGRTSSRGDLREIPLRSEDKAEPLLSNGGRGKIDGDQDLEVRRGGEGHHGAVRCSFSVASMSRNRRRMACSAYPRPRCRGRWRARSRRGWASRGVHLDQGIVHLHPVEAERKCSTVEIFADPAASTVA